MCVYVVGKWYRGIYEYRIESFCMSNKKIIFFSNKKMERVLTRQDDINIIYWTHLKVNKRKNLLLNRE